MRPNVFADAALLMDMVIDIGRPTDAYGESLMRCLLTRLGEINPYMMRRAVYRFGYPS